MTHIEKLRVQDSAREAKAVVPDVRWDRLPLTRLALYILSLSDDERGNKAELLNESMHSAARRTLRHASLSLGRVAAVLDNSYSSSGSSEKRRRPLAVAVASHYLLNEASREYRAFWTTPVSHPLAARAQGQSDLATPILDALEWGAELVVIISDGSENDPPFGASELLRVYRTKLDYGKRVSIIHCNPVFDREDFLLRHISEHIPTVGLRDAEDLPTMLGFAAFADGALPLEALHQYVAERALAFIAAA